MTITDNLSGFANAPFAYTHSYDNKTDAEGNNYYSTNHLDGNRYWHGFGFVSVKNNIVTINKITVKDHAGNSRIYKNNPIKCEYSKGGRDPKSYNCPTKNGIYNPESDCTLNLN